MKPPAQPSFRSVLAAALVIMAAVSWVVFIFLPSRHPVPQSVPPPVDQAPPDAANLPTQRAATDRMHLSATGPAVLANNPGFQKRPFPVAIESPKDQWTSADGRDTNVIRQLAHNPLEYERMVGENDKIKRRQLVYLKDPITMVIDRARNAGESVHSFTLPGLDGQEYSVEVTQNTVERTRMAGSLSGHLKGQVNSLVSIGFAEGYESFNIFSPDDKIYIVADAREPGEVMVKEIDPAKYGVFPRTDQPDFIPTK